MKKVESNLSLIAAIITIINFIIVMPGAISESWIPLDIAKAISLPTKVVLVTILEISLAYAFGRLFASAHPLDEVTKFVCFVTIAITSAWISIFNIESLLIGRVVSGFGEYFGLFIMLIIAWGVASAMISGHIQKSHGQSEETAEDTKGGILIQGLSYLFIFTSLIFR